jgi:hypothetical protein
MVNDKLKTVLASLTSVCRQMSVSQSAFAKILAKDVPGVSVEVRQALVNLTEHSRHLRDALGEVGRIIATLDS